MLIHCVTGRLCGTRRGRSTALRFAVFGGALVSWTSAKAAEAPAKIGVELNRLEEQGGSCRAYLVISNPGSAEYSGFALDLVVFDRGGTIMRRLAVDVAPVRPSKNQ